MATKPRIAHISGPNATIQNSPPLITSNKARVQYGLPLMKEADGEPAKYDVLRSQKLAAPVTVYIEQFSGHPLEKDAAELYGPPDGYLDAAGTFHEKRRSPSDKPVFRVELKPEDGPYPLPYMARQADGSAWDYEGVSQFAAGDKSRQGFYPDGSRVFQEIDRFGVSSEGKGNLISAFVDVDFFRVSPPAGYTKGLPKGEHTHRTLNGEAADLAPETRGEHFFPYHPPHLSEQPPRSGLALVANEVQKILASGDYLGAIWTQGSPRIEETVYWFNLILDTHLPLCGNAAQRFHGMISNDGPKNIVDSVDYITSKVWADHEGRDRVGTVLIQEQQIFASRDVQKGDARPGGYVTTGGHGGIIGGSGHDGEPTLTYLPAKRHTFASEVNISKLPAKTTGVTMKDGKIVPVEVAVKDKDGWLLGSAIPKISIIKDGSYFQESFADDPSREVDLLALIDDNLARTPLSGFVIEGYSPYGKMTSETRHRLMVKAAYSGMPVVRVGRGNNSGFTPLAPPFISGRNLTSTKARMLLIASLLKFGMLPAAADPGKPTDAEKKATLAKTAQYQAVFDTH